MEPTPSAQMSRSASACWPLASVTDTRSPCGAKSVTSASRWYRPVPKRPSRDRYMVFQDENQYRCGCSCWTLPSRCRKRIQLVLEHTSSARRPPRSVRYRSVLSRTASPAPRAVRAAGERSKTWTSQPASRSTSAAVRPPIDPPTTLTAGISGRTGNESGAAERGDLDDPHLEQHPAFVDGRIAQGVRRLVARVLHPDPVELIGDALALGRVVLGDLPLQHGLDADPVVGIRRVDQQEGGVRRLAQPVDLLAVDRKSTRL